METSFRFLDLPPQLRALVYVEALTFGDNYRTSLSLTDQDGRGSSESFAVSGLLLVSKLVNSEAAPIFYVSNRFNLKTKLHQKNLGAFINRLSLIDPIASSYASMKALLWRVDVECGCDCAHERLMIPMMAMIRGADVNVSWYRRYHGEKCRATSKCLQVDIGGARLSEALRAMLEGVRRGWRDSTG